MPLHNPFANPGAQEQTSVLQVPQYVVWSVMGFLKCWWQTRRLGWLVQGLPALALTGLLASLLISSEQPVSHQTVSAYLGRAKEALQLEEFEQAEFYLRKLGQLAPDDREVIDQRAELYAAQENWREAVRLKESLLSDSSTLGDAQVHKWLAETALEQDLGIESPLEYARGHLVAVLNDNPDDPQAHLFFARLCQLEGDLPNSIRHLEKISTYSTDVQLQLAAMYLQLRPPDRIRATTHARTVAGSLSKLIDTTQTSNVTTFHQLAVAYVILEEFDSAVDVLRQAIRRFDEEATRRQLARVYVAWADSVRQQDPQAMGRRIALLEQALELAPNEPQVLHRMLEIATAEGEGAVEAEAALRKVLVDGVATAAVHFSLGTLAAKRGDSEMAMQHFRQSEQLNPRTAVTLNNMAYVMAQMPEADLQQALEMAQQAVTMAPNAAPFRDTRGQILVRLQRWSEAITDLEYANARMPQPTSKLAINRALAAAYRGLGDETTAAAYDQKAAEIAATLPQQPAAAPGESPEAGATLPATLSTIEGDAPPDSDPQQQP